MCSSADSPLAGALKGAGNPSLLGSLLAGKYRIRSLIGSGGTSDVYAAEHHDIGKSVAIKILQSHRASDARSVARFLREARVVASLKHSNVCEVFDLGRLPDGRPFLVMERLVGETLADRLRREAFLAPRDIVEIMCALLSGLTAVHQVGAIHRDLKPANVFLAQRRGEPPTTKLLDFGVARSSTGSHTPITTVGFIVGTPVYMSPEQITGGRKLDARSDIWSAGVILYEALVGQPPFWSPKRSALLHQITSAPHRPLREVDPSIPAPLVSVVDRALAKQKEERFGSATGLRDALLALVSSGAVTPPSSPSEKLAAARPAAPERMLPHDLPLGRSGLPLIDLDGTTEETPAIPLVAGRPPPK